MQKLGKKVFLNKSDSVVKFGRIVGKSKAKLMDYDSTSVSRDEIITKHLNYAYWLALYYCPQGSQLCDYVGEANLGLTIAANRACDDKDKLSYFLNFTKKHIQARLNTFRWLDISLVQFNKEYRQVLKGIYKQVEALKREYETEYIDVIDVINLETNRCGEYLLRAIKSFDKSVSFDVPFEGNDSLLNYISGENIDVNAEIEKYVKHKDILIGSMRKVLTDIEFTLITEIFGLFTGKPRDLLVLASDVGIGMQSAYKYYNSAICKLKQPMFLELLVDLSSIDISLYTNWNDLNKVISDKYKTLVKKEFQLTQQEHISNKVFTYKEVEFVRENYVRMDRKKILELINSDRPDNLKLSDSQFRRYVRQLGLTNQKRFWNEQQEEFLRINFGQISSDELAIELSKLSTNGISITYEAIKKKAYRMGIKNI